MSSIKDFSKTRTQNKTTNENYEKILKDNSEKASNLQDDINKYKNLSQNDLMQELMQEAGKLKRSGRLNESSLNMLKSTLAPMLSPEQNQVLENIIDKIK